MSNNEEVYNQEEIQNKNKKDVFSDGVKQISKLFKFMVIPIILILFFNMFTYTVKEDEVAVVKRLGQVVQIVVDRDNSVAVEQNKIEDEYKNVKILKDKGLFFKIPFITSVQKETSKLLTYISSPSEVNTNDKRQYIVSFFAQYEITHPALYQKTLGSKAKANSILDDQIYPIVIQRINKLQSEEFLTEKEKLYATLEDGIDELNKKVESLGVILKDIEIHRTILPHNNIQSTYDKMIAEREAVAEEIRANGKEAYDKTVAEVDKQVIEIKSGAIEESETIKGEADGEALEIYAKAYSVDPEFYEFWRTLQAYEETIDSNTTIYMDRNNEFLKYFTNN